MKGLSSIPSVEALIGAYSVLQSASDHAEVGQLALWSQWARFDPRLAEQWVGHLASRWRRIDPVSLHEAIEGHPWPAAVGALLAQVEYSGLLRTGERRLFRAWAACVTSGFASAEGEQFFIGLRAFGGDAMRLDAEHSLAPYLRWGYLSREILVNKASAREAGRTLLPHAVRQRILEGLIRALPRLTVRDYLEAAGGGVSRRQAELDLRRCPRLVGRGRTRGRYYVRK